MKSLQTHINEALVAGRAWSGKLRNIDELLSWMYDNDILTKSEKRQKDSIFSQYSRWYNDGDMPALAKKLGLSEYDKEQVEIALEKAVTTFIKSILSKYAGKYSRRDYRYSQQLRELRRIKASLSRESRSVNSFIYFYDNTKFEKNDELSKLVEKLVSTGEKFDRISDKLIDDNLDKWENSWDVPKGLSFSSKARKMKAKNVWNSELESLFKEIDKLMSEIEYHIDLVITAVQRAQKLNLD